MIVQIEFPEIVERTLRTHRNTVSERDRIPLPAKQGKAETRGKQEARKASTRDWIKTGMLVGSKKRKTGRGIDGEKTGRKRIGKVFNFVTYQIIADH